MEIHESTENGVVTLKLVGKLDTVTAPDFQEKLVSLIDEGNSTVIIECSMLDYVSSAGLRILLMGQKKVKPSGGALKLVGVKPMIKQVFDISGFSKLFQFFETLEDVGK